MSIASILESAPELANLAIYAVPDGPLPPKGTSLIIWTYLAESLFPGTLGYALKDVQPQHRSLRAFLVLAQAARLPDHASHDAKSPSEEVWHRQISGVNAYLEFREKFRLKKGQFIAEFEDLQQRSQRVSEQIDDVDRQWAELDAEEVQIQFQEQNRIVSQLRLQLNDVVMFRNDLVRRKEASATKFADLQRSLDSLAQQLRISRHHAELLDLVANIKVHQLEPTINQTLAETSKLQAKHDQQQSILEQYKYTMHVFDELIPQLQTLLTIETDVLSKKEQRNLLEANQLRPLLLRAQTIRQQIEASTQEIQHLHTKTQTLSSEIEALNAELVKEAKPESETESNNPKLTAATFSEFTEDEEIQVVTSKLAELKAEEKELKAVINMQRQWLRAMNDVEKWAADLAKENEQIKRWMQTYLESH